jgi:hypothetical protein
LEREPEEKSSGSSSESIICVRFFPIKGESYEIYTIHVYLLFGHNCLYLSGIGFGDPPFNGDGNCRSITGSLGGSGGGVWEK